MFGLEVREEVCPLGRYPNLSERIAAVDGHFGLLYAEVSSCLSSNRDRHWKV